MHIRADVLTKTVGSDKKLCGGGGGSLPRNRRKIVTAADESKECLSENDLCYGGIDGEGSRECDYDYDEDDGDDDDDSAGRVEDSADVRLGDCSVHEQTNGLAAAAAVERCKERRQRGRRPKNGRRRGERMTDIAGQEDSREQQQMAADDDRPRRDTARDETSTVKAIKIANDQQGESPTNVSVAKAASNIVQHGVYGHGNRGDGAADADDGKQRGDQLNAPGENGNQDHYDPE